ncbi:hypothetical protein GCM10023176_49350 [Micromonospora coerulea]|uniref:Uncharacterized protein n=1 Tax=Micromonospora coerulea TaxID=47856 RepID=A0ABP8SYJ8_9ACTN
MLDPIRNTDLNAEKVDRGRPGGAGGRAPALPTEPKDLGYVSEVERAIFSLEMTDRPPNTVP